MKKRTTWLLLAILVLPSMSQATLWTSIQRRPMTYAAAVVSMGVAAHLFYKFCCRIQRWQREENARQLIKEGTNYLASLESAPVAAFFAQLPTTLTDSAQGTRSIETMDRALQCLSHEAGEFDVSSYIRRYKHLLLDLQSTGKLLYSKKITTGEEGAKLLQEIRALYKQLLTHRERLQLLATQQALIERWQAVERRLISIRQRLHQWQDAIVSTKEQYTQVVKAVRQFDRDRLYLLQLAQEEICKNHERVRVALLTQVISCGTVLSERLANFLLPSLETLYKDATVTALLLEQVGVQSVIYPYATVAQQTQANKKAVEELHAAVQGFAQPPLVARIGRLNHCITQALAALVNDPKYQTEQIVKRQDEQMQRMQQAYEEQLAAMRRQQEDMAQQLRRQEQERRRQEDQDHRQRH